MLWTARPPGRSAATVRAAPSRTGGHPHPACPARSSAGALPCARSAAGLWADWSVSSGPRTDLDGAVEPPIAGRFRIARQNHVRGFSATGRFRCGIPQPNAPPDSPGTDQDCCGRGRRAARSGHGRLVASVAPSGDRFRAPGQCRAWSYPVRAGERLPQSGLPFDAGRPATGVRLW